MPNLNATIKARQAVMAAGPANPDQDKSLLYVTEKHYEWKRRSSRDQVPNQAALDFALMVLKGDDYVPRGPGETRFTASRIGDDCDRRVMFGFVNAPKEPFTVRSQDRMDQGSSLHLAWQIEGLSAGWLVDAEQWVQHPHAKIGVKYDGRLADDMGLLELKFTNSNLYRKIIRGDREAGKPPGPSEGHRLQCEVALWLFDEQWMSLVYVNTDDGDFVEYRLQRSARWQAEIDERMDRFFGYVDTDTLPEMHEECVGESSPRYLRCQYRAICPAAGKVTLSSWTSTASTSEHDGSPSPAPQPVTSPS